MTWQGLPSKSLKTIMENYNLNKNLIKSRMLWTKFTHWCVYKPVHKVISKISMILAVWIMES
jgi:hypothetical protein